MQDMKTTGRPRTFVPTGDIPCGAAEGIVPSLEECRAIWADLGMPGHIREHSFLVAEVALDIARMFSLRLLPGLDLRMVEAAALLHDVAKYYTIQNGGSHNQLGAAWVQEWTGNALLSRAVLHHVHWPFSMNVRLYPVSLIVFYSDKRVKHTEIVGMEERFKDLSERYGKTPQAREHIQLSLKQGLAVEALLGQELEVDLNAHTFDCRWMVR